MVSCPVCSKVVKQSNINAHLDSDCTDYVEAEDASSQSGGSFQANSSVSSFFQTPLAKRAPSRNVQRTALEPTFIATPRTTPSKRSLERSLEQTNTPTNTHINTHTNDSKSQQANEVQYEATFEPEAKRQKQLNAFQKAAPLADRMRPTTLDEICGQELVGPSGVLRGLIEQDRVPSMILWGDAGTGKTTIARVIANIVGSRFIEINSTSSGVAECKKIFAEARSELGLAGRKTIIFCDEIHRFSKSQQDVFLGPVENGTVTLIGATTENPSFKVQSALLSRCRTFTLQKLSDSDITNILHRALKIEGPNYSPSSLVDEKLIHYLAAFADGDARTALNLLELAMELSKREGMTLDDLKKALTKTLVYDRAGDQHYDTISAFIKSMRGSDPDAALYYLARMLQSGEDAVFIARRMVVFASEDIGLADNSMLSLATAAFTAAEKIGMPEARINLAHAAVALSLSKKSTRSYRGLNNATEALQEPGVAALPIPIHLRNAPTRLMKELGYGKEYKYNPDHVDGRVKQNYLPQQLVGRTFLEDADLGSRHDPDLGADCV